MDIKDIIHSLYSPNNCIELGLTLYKKSPDLFLDYIDYFFDEMPEDKVKLLIKKMCDEETISYEIFTHIKNFLEKNNKLEKDASFHLIADFLTQSYLSDNIAKENEVDRINIAFEFINAINHESAYIRKIHILERIYQPKTVSFEKVRPLFLSILNDHQFKFEEFIENEEIKKICSKNALFLANQLNNEVNAAKKDEFNHFMIKQFINSKNSKMLNSKEESLPLYITKEDIEEIKNLTNNNKINLPLVQLLLNSKEPAPLIKHFHSIKRYQNIFRNTSKLFMPTLLKGLVNDNNISLEEMKIICDEKMLDALRKDKYQSVFNELKKNNFSFNEKLLYLTEKMDIPFFETIKKSNDLLTKVAKLVNKPQEIKFLLNTHKKAEENLANDAKTALFETVSLKFMITKYQFINSSFKEMPLENIELFFQLMFKDSTLNESIEKISKYSYSEMKPEYETKKQELVSILEQRVIESNLNQVENQTTKRKQKI